MNNKFNVGDLIVINDFGKEQFCATKNLESYVFVVTGTRGELNIYAKIISCSDKHQIGNVVFVGSVCFEKVRHEEFFVRF